MIKPIPITTDLEILKSPNEEVYPEEIEDLISKLEISLANVPIGIGLAAPQISINKRAAIVRIKDKKIAIDLINPIIIDKREPFTNKDEMCLSIPGTKANVQRFNEIFIKDYLHPAGVVLTGIEAIAVQHEIDHIENILITDRALGKLKVGRNDPCPCGKKIDGKPVKFKRCHGR